MADVGRPACSRPPRCASISACSASSLDSRSGAKPPSSPTAVPRPALVQHLLEVVEDLGAHAQRLAEASSARAGTIMNSWKSTLLSACLPPLRMFIIGTGSTWAAVAAEVAVQRQALLGRGGLRDGQARRRGSRWRRGGPCWACRRGRSAPGRAPRWSRASMPAIAGAISPLTLATACVTPLPRSSASSPSRSSSASCSPVEAPEGTAARPVAPERRATSTSTVGLPRESRIWRAWTASISLTAMGSLVGAAARRGGAGR